MHLAGVDLAVVKPLHPTEGSETYGVTYGVTLPYTFGVTFRGGFPGACFSGLIAREIRAPGAPKFPAAYLTSYAGRSGLSSIIASKRNV